MPVLSLYPIQFIYNVSQIFLCAYMTIEAGMIGYRNSYTFLTPCNVFNPTAAPTANLLWLFYISKVWDFWDTIFIVLGKKWRQLSFLHVYHHTTIFLFYWVNVNVNYDGDIFLTILLNGFIHTVMYTYYCTLVVLVSFSGTDNLLLTTRFTLIFATVICMHTKVPETGKSLPIWWKSSLTMMQLIQFITMMTQGSYMYLNHCTKASPPRVVLLYILYIVSLFILFAQFFVASYMTKPVRGPKIKRA
jgi:GNS1/SUR4 family